MQNMGNSSKFFDVIVNVLPGFASLTVHSCVCQHTVIALKNVTIPPATRIQILLLKEESHTSISIYYLKNSLVAADIVLQILPLS